MPYGGGYQLRGDGLTWRRQGEVMAGGERNYEMGVRKSVLVGAGERIDAEIVILVVVAMRVAVMD